MEKKGPKDVGMEGNRGLEMEMELAVWELRWSICVGRYN